PTPPAPPAGPPLLIAALFEWTSADGGPWVRLTFDRAVMVVEGEFDPSAIVVDDNVHTDNLFRGTGAAVALSAVALQVSLVVVGGASGVGGSLLTAAGAGIVAVDGGEVWAGVSEVAIPFG